MIDVVLFLDKKKNYISHFSQAIHGFVLLAKQRMIRLTFAGDTLPVPRNCFIAEMDGKRVVFDLDDGIGTSTVEMNQRLNTCDLYFKRSYSEEFARTLDHKGKLVPYGLNYVKFPCFSSRLGTKLERFFGIKIRHITTGQDHWTLSDTREVDDVLFATRLWDAENTNDPLREKINADRIHYVKELRKNFSQRSHIGIIDSPLARQMCPEFILSDRETRRIRYMEFIKKAKVCVTTTGLSRSIGWRFGEYVAAGKVIVTEPLSFEVPGNFRKNVHYLTFESSDDLCAGCHECLTNDSLREHMKINNRLYYFQYLKPDILILNTIMTTLNS